MVYFDRIEVVNILNETSGENFYFKPFPTFFCSPEHHFHNSVRCGEALHYRLRQAAGACVFLWTCISSFFSFFSVCLPSLSNCIFFFFVFTFTDFQQSSPRSQPSLSLNSYFLLLQRKHSQLTRVIFFSFAAPIHFRKCTLRNSIKLMKISKSHCSKISMKWRRVLKFR